MTEEEFIGYCETYSSRNFEACFDKYYRPSAIFENPEGKYIGKDEVTAFWYAGAGREGLRETLVPPKNILITEDRVAAEL